MRVWLYARLSNDDAREMNSLLNQQEICQAFAEQHGYTIVYARLVASKSRYAVLYQTVMFLH